MIYLDTNVIIYAIENHPKYGNKCKEILNDTQSEKFKAYCSVLVLIEMINVLTKINKALRNAKQKELDIRENIDAVLSLPITWVDTSFPIIQRAAEYRYGISGIDYIHIATMELNGVNKIISADTDFDEVKFIERIDPLDYK
jgi:predicted nucleic acid-binding protein